MATLVLSTVGTAIAGPIGGLLGSLVGQSIDQQLIGGGPRKGPRLGDLSVQTSSYGTQIPRVYGCMRVAGTIVWATDLKESSELQGDGKSQPETVVYTYSVSLAVALSSRPALRVKRIWADGTLIRGAAGDFKVNTKFRFYPGSEGQPVDPLIGSIEGQSPAFRGLALAVFEDLQLAQFGNRIPALTFELVADDGEGVEIDAMLADASRGAILSSDSRTISGYAAHGADMVSAIAPLVEAFAVELYDDGSALRSPGKGSRLPASSELGVGADGASTTTERALALASGLPRALTLSYYDAARDYQTGQARSSLPAASKVTRALSLPCVLESGAAKAVAENLLQRAWALRDKLRIRLPLNYCDVSPGALFRLPDIPGDWVAEDIEIEGFVVSIALRPAWYLAGARSADPGRSIPQPDIVAAPTRLALFDLPDPETSQPTMALVAASPSGGWMPVPIEIDIAGALVASRTASVEAVMGTAATALGDGQQWLTDMANTVEVQLVNPAHWLQSRDEEAIAMGANLAAIGDEIIQFGEAQAIGLGRFRLAKLLRGRRGSEWAMVGHVAGEDFVLLDQRSIKPIVLPVDALGTEVAVTAHGPGDGSDATAVRRAANGEAMRPLSPARLRAGWENDGSLSLAWTLRSRLAWAWLDDVDTPADPSVQGYRVELIAGGGTIQRDCADENISFTAAEVAALGAGAIQCHVRQVGLLALSRPATVIINS